MARKVSSDPWSAAVRLLLLVYNGLWSGVVAIWVLFRLGFPHPSGWAAFGQRLGLFPRRPARAPVSLWVHAVSVGELLSVQSLLDEVKRCHPDWWIVVSTGNEHGYRLARGWRNLADATCLLPWDFGPCVRTALDRARPDVLVLVECELWPNLLTHAADRGVKIVMVNARIYPRAMARGYRPFRGLFGPLLRQMTLIGAQSTEDRDRFLVLGANPATLRLAGNTKFDVTPTADLERR